MRLSDVRTFRSQTRIHSANQYPLRRNSRWIVWIEDEFVLDPTKITLHIGRTGVDGDTFKNKYLMDKYKSFHFRYQRVCVLHFDCDISPLTVREFPYYIILSAN